MTHIEIAFILFYVFGITVVSYKGYARKKKLEMGKWFHSDTNAYRETGALVFLASILVGFVVLKWYKVVAGMILGWMICYGILHLFKEASRAFSLLVLVLALVFLGLYFI